MEKKTYMKPSVKVVLLDCTVLLTVSGNVNDGGMFGYHEDDYNDYIGGCENAEFGFGDPD